MQSSVSSGLKSTYKSQKTGFELYLRLLGHGHFTLWDLPFTCMVTQGKQVWIWESKEMVIIVPLRTEIDETELAVDFRFCVMFFSIHSPDNNHSQYVQNSYNIAFDYLCFRRMYLRTIYRGFPTNTISTTTVFGLCTCKWGIFALVGDPLQSH